MRASPSATRSPPRCAGSTRRPAWPVSAQTILQLAVPGIADIYQGTEFWDHSLVDPDNRRPVDWTAREEALAGGVWIDFADDAIGLAKFRTLRRLLALRRANPDLVAEGRYEPVAVTEGPARFVAFLRRWPTGSLLVAVPTRPTRLAARETLDRPAAGPLAERHERSRVRDRLRRPGARPELAFRPRA